MVFAILWTAGCYCFIIIPVFIFILKSICQYNVSTKRLLKLNIYHLGNTASSFCFLLFVIKNNGVIVGLFIKNLHTFLYQLSKVDKRLNES